MLHLWAATTAVRPQPLSTLPTLVHPNPLPVRAPLCAQPVSCALGLICLVPLRPLRPVRACVRGVAACVAGDPSLRAVLPFLHGLPLAVAQQVEGEVEVQVPYQGTQGPPARVWALAPVGTGPWLVPLAAPPDQAQVPALCREWSVCEVGWGVASWCGAG